MRSNIAELPAKRALAAKRVLVRLPLQVPHVVDVEGRRGVGLHTLRGGQSARRADSE
jgi:hypothetical protein